MNSENVSQVIPAIEDRHGNDTQSTEQSTFPVDYVEFTKQCLKEIAQWKAKFYDVERENTDLKIQLRWAESGSSSRATPAFPEQTNLDGTSRQVRSLFLRLWSASDLF